MTGKLKRRHFLNAVPVAAAAPALAQQARRARPDGGAAADPSSDIPVLKVSTSDQVAEPGRLFLSAEQFAALKRLSALLMPSKGSRPGAEEAGAAEFLDFLLSQSPAERQRVYHSGLDGLNAQSRKQFGKAFDAVEAAQAERLMAPLKEPWTQDPPKDPVALMLQTAKRDVRVATVNSREYSASGAAPTARRGFGGLYWYPLD